MLPVALALFAEYSGSYVVPLEHDAIAYAKLPVHDPIAKLQQRLTAGDAKLEWDERGGYLASVLKELKIPVESQVLVFSKTSFQAPRIAPGTPRALYFADDVSVGFVRGGDVLEFAANDPKQGTVFYTLNQDPDAKPRLERRDMCLQCHASGATAGVPGWMVRSVFPEQSGMPLFQAGSFVTDHRSPLKERWGGWYVTGSTGKQTHMGNAVVRDRNTPDKLDTANPVRFDSGAYLSPHSDVVALMVLEHQTRMSNILTRLGYETRLAMHTQVEMNRILKRPENELGESAERRITSGVEEVAGYMLFADEPVLTERITGSSGFEKVFATAGPRDSKGRSLRDFDLQRRLFRYPCSYMIYSDAFDSLPAPARERLIARLKRVLTGEDKSPKFAHLSQDDRSDILEILRATKPGF